MKSAYIVSAVRTPIGSFGGSLADVTATQLGSAAIKGALEKIQLPADSVEEVYFGNVCSSNVGQAPARQAAIGAGLPYGVQCTTINKVCASGMKATMLAAQSIMLGLADVVVAGGMESMSNIPFYVPKARFGYKFGGGEFVDGLQKDVLSDAYDNQAMGTCADATATKYNVSREAQDAFATQSYQRSAAATEAGKFANEIVPVTMMKRGVEVIITEDEEYKKGDFSKFATLRPAFNKDGTVTAANASTINDGASALIVVSEEALAKYNLKPLARIVAFADAEQEPKWFTTTPVIAAKKALDRAGLTTADIDFVEVNEAFSVVAMVFNQEMGFSESKANVYGGAVSLGHPVGMSGARIITTLNSVLHQEGGKYGLAAICNGGGGASAIIIEKM